MDYVPILYLEGYLLSNILVVNVGLESLNVPNVALQDISSHLESVPRPGDTALGYPQGQRAFMNGQPPSFLLPRSSHFN
jgi:hypothetical protein